MFPGGRAQNMQSGGQPPMVQYPGMYYGMNNPVSAPSWRSNNSAQADDGRDLLAESYERMRNEMRSLQGATKPDAPPPPSMDSSRDNAAIKMLLTNENVSLSSLLEAAMDPSSGSNKGTEDPIMKKTILDKCEGKIAQLYRHRISGMGTFFPNVPPKGTKANSSCFLTFHHPQIEFNMKGIDSVWNCPEVNVEAGQRKKTAETAVKGDSVKPKRDKSPALEAAEVYANKPNPSVSTNLFGNNEPEPGKPTELPPGPIPGIGPPGPISVIGPRQSDVQVVDLTSYPEPPPDPYATTAFELWAEIERERRHKEKLKEWELLNEKHKQKDREKEERKKKKKRHRHSRSGSRSRSPSGSRSRRRSRSYSRSRSRHRERRWRSRSRRRTRSISLSPSPSRKRSGSPRLNERRRLSPSPQRRSSPILPHSPQRRSSPIHRMRSPRPLLNLPLSPPRYPGDPRLQPGPPGDEWPTSTAWPQSTSIVPPSSEYYQYGSSQVYPEGGDYYYGNNRPYPPYNMPHYGLRPPYPHRGYPMGGPPGGGGPHMWGPRGHPPYGYRPPRMDVAPPPPAASSTNNNSKNVIKRTYVKSTSNPNVFEVYTAPVEMKKQGHDSTNKKLKTEPNVKVIPLTTPKIDDSSQKPTDVIILDDDDGTDAKTVPKASSGSEDHPPGVSPDRELPHTTLKMAKESEFTKPLRAKFRELLEPLEKILDTLRVRQRDSQEFKTLIKGLEIGSCEFDGVYTLVEGILCRVVIDAIESAKTCFKIVLSPVHVTPILMEIHKMYHDYSSSKIKRMIEDVFYDSRQFPSWKIGNVIAICKQCKIEKEARRKKRDEKEGALQKSSERDESDVDWESRSKSKSSRRRSESGDRDDAKKGRRGSKDDRKSHHGKKRELKDVSLKGCDGDVLLNVVADSSKKVEESPKQTAGGTEKDTDSGDDKNELRKIEFITADAAESETRVVKKDVKGKYSSSKPASSGANHSELPDASSEKKDGAAQPNPAPSERPQVQKIEDASGENDENSGSIKAAKKPLVSYGFGKSNKPEDFKLRVRRAQMSVDDLKTHITSLEGTDEKSADPNFLLKAGMLCKRVPSDDGKTEVKIAVTPQSLSNMIQIVHTMAATHAPLEKTITVFNKHFTPIRGVQEAVSIVLNNCEVCKSS